MIFKNLWLNKAVNKKIKDSFYKENIKSLEDFKRDGYNIPKELGFDIDPSIYCIKNQLNRSLVFFLKHYMNEDILEDLFIIVKKEDLFYSEKIITLYCQKKSNLIKSNSFKYRQFKSKSSFLSKMF